jgi:hypothetical protein
VTKAELQKHGEKLANVYRPEKKEELGDQLITKFCNSFGREVREGYTDGFSEALELLFPLVDALKNSAAPRDLNEKTKVIEVLTECAIRENVCKKALAELEKKVRGE